METSMQERRGGPARLAPKRDHKLQVLLSGEERMRLDELAQAAGYESAAAFIRAQTLGRAALGQTPAAPASIV